MPQVTARLRDRSAPGWPALAARLRRHRLTLGCLAALVLLALMQRPGRVTFDTKLDLAVDPAGFMARSLHLWNPEATSGELQNQAYGYLFPMGPFFAAGQALGVPMWLTQRIWCALLLCVAFAGVLLLARALRIGTAPARHVGALAYALAPRMLTEVGTLSSEMLPAVLLPWVLLPLVTVDRIGSVRRAAGLSALAVLCMGGVNAAMVLMALVLPGLYLVTRRFDRAHLALVGWWVVAVASVVLWWFLPLLLLGRYSLPFLAYIESAANTTGVVSLFQAVRGTNQWVAYVVEGEPWWPAGWMLVDQPVLMLATMAVGGLGLAGLAMHRLPERRFLVVAALAGLVLLTAGFVGALDSPLSGWARHLLDGPLAPFRNVHKFEPVLRLPLALGFTHAVSGGLPALRWRRWRLPPVSGRWARAAPALALVVVAAAPAWTFALRPGPGWSDLPGYWRQAATWLAAEDRNARTLVVPGSGFGHYRWGRTIDEPIQALAGAPWALRNQIPLGSEGNTRVLDTVEEVLSAGRGSAGLADYLSRNGFRYLLLRNDLDRVRTDAPPIAVLRQAIAGSPGISPAASFGPQLSPPDAGRSPVDDGERPPPAIEVYQVGRPVPLARTVVSADLATVSGGPESTLPLLEQGLLRGDRPAVLAGDLPPGTAAGSQWLVTDGLRRRERNVGRVRDNLSHTLAADEERRQARAALDILPFAGTQHQTVAVYQGVRSVTAASAASYADVLGRGTQPSNLPFAAVDGDPTTAWHSATPDGPQGQWLEVALGTPRRLTEVGVEFVDDVRVGWEVTRFRLTTDYGSVEHAASPGAGRHVYPLPPGGLVTTVRLTVLDVLGSRPTGNVGVRELTLAGTRPERALRVPADAGDATAPPGYAFTRGHHARPACYPDGSAVRCDPTQARIGEEPHGLDRLFRTPAAARYGLAVTAVPRPGGASPVPASTVAAEASSWLGGDPRVAPYAAVDGDPTTAWLADVGDRNPTLRLRWTGQRSVAEIRVRFAGRPVAARPTVVELLTPTAHQVVDLRADGSASFPAMLTDRLDIRVVAAGGRVLDRRGNRSEATTGFAEVAVPALADLRRSTPSSTPFAVPCGEGPTVELDGASFATSVSGTLADYTAGRPLPLTVCDLFAADALDLPAGEHRLRAEPSAHFVVQDAALRPVGSAPAEPPPRERATEVLRWDPTSRVVRVAPGEESLLVVPENANAGWRATLGGVALTAARVDGWQQAYTVPAGAGGLVTLEFVPDASYRDGLAAGAAAALVAVVLAAVPVLGRRRVGVLAAPPAGGYGSTVLTVVLVAALAGVLSVVLLIAGALVRQLRPRMVARIALAGALAATVVAVVGRLAGQGQSWAYGPVAQAAMLVAVCAGVAAGAVRIPGGVHLDPAVSPELDGDPRGDQQGGGDRGGRGDLADRVAEPEPDQPGLDPDGQPDSDDRPQVRAGDPGVEEDLGGRQQRPGEREEPERGGLTAVPGAADER